jgi:hypothetical protein
MVTGLDVKLHDFNAHGWTNSHPVLIEIGAHAKV